MALSGSGDAGLRRAAARRSGAELAALLFVVAALWIVGGWVLVEARGRLAAGVAREAGNLAQLAAETTDRTLVQVEAVLRAAQSARVAGLPPAALALPPGMSLTLSDHDGRIVWSDVPESALDGEPADLAAEPAFRHFATFGARDLFVGAPASGRLSHRWSVSFARRLVAAGGDFDGVALLAVEPERFMAGLSALDLGHAGTVQLLRADGTVLGRVGGVASGALLGDHVDLASAAPPAADGPAPVGTAERRLERAPLRVRVTLDFEDDLAGWRAECCAAGFFGLLVSGAALAAWARLRRLRNADAARGAAFAAMQDAADAALSATDAAVQARAALGHVLGRDVRTPLNGILGGLELLHDTPLDAEQTGLAEAMQRAAHDLLRLLDGWVSPLGEAATEAEAVGLQPCIDAPAPDEAAARAERLRVLLVDDNRVNRVIGAHMLERLGHAVVSVESGADAVAAVAAGACDLVIMDVMMPGMDGLAATRAIRTLPEPARSCPVVGLTANVSRADRAACRDAGMDGFLAKPVTRQKLAAAVALAVSLRRARPGRLSGVPTTGKAQLAASDA